MKLRKLKGCFELTEVTIRLTISHHFLSFILVCISKCMVFYMTRISLKRLFSTLFYNSRWASKHYGSVAVATFLSVLSCSSRIFLFPLIPSYKQYSTLIQCKKNNLLANICYIFSAFHQHG